MKKSANTIQRLHRTFYIVMILLAIFINVSVVYGLKKIFDYKHRQDFNRLAAQRLEEINKKSQALIETRLHELIWDRPQYLKLENFISQNSMTTSFTLRDIKTKSGFYLKVRLIDNPEDLTAEEYVRVNMPEINNQVEKFDAINLDAVRLHNYPTEFDTTTLIAHHYIVYQLTLQGDHTKQTTPSYKAEELFKNILSSLRTITSNCTITGVTDHEYYNGSISLRIPYTGLEFRELDVHNFTPRLEHLDQNDFHCGNVVIDAYTFTANAQEDFEFVSEEDWKSNPGSFISTELYGWGPTVIRMDTRLGWGAPVTGRYFYLVIGGDNYGPNFEAPSGLTYNGSKYGTYLLSVTQRK